MLPFTVDQFFSVFTAYNSAIWPAQIVAYVLGAVALWAILAARPWAGRAVAGILAIFWAWNGLAYHLGFFAPINPAANGFAAVFVLQSVLFFSYGTVAGRLRFADRIDWRGVVGIALIAYSAVIYTALGYALGHSWPRIPVFGVAPCPTTIFTFGVLLLAAGPLPLWLITIPVVWAAIGATAAALLDVPEDLGLLVAGLLGAALLPFWGVTGEARPPKPIFRSVPVLMVHVRHVCPRYPRCRRPLPRANSCLQHVHRSGSDRWASAFDVRSLRRQGTPCVTVIGSSKHIRPPSGVLSPWIWPAHTSKVGLNRVERDCAEWTSPQAA